MSLSEILKGRRDFLKESGLVVGAIFGLDTKARLDKIQERLDKLAEKDPKYIDETFQLHSGKTGLLLLNIGFYDLNLQELLVFDEFGRSTLSYHIEKNVLVPDNNVGLSIGNKDNPNQHLNIFGESHTGVEPCRIDSAKMYFSEYHPNLGYNWGSSLRGHNEFECYGKVEKDNELRNMVQALYNLRYKAKEIYKT